MERRELLYAVVREAMVRAGVLSSSYKFKVLSLDPRGRQFMVMVDLAEGAASDTSRLAEIEAMIAQSAKARYEIVVSAVYWRANEHVAIGDAAHFTAHKPIISQPAPLLDHHHQHHHHAAAISRPAPLSDLVSRPAELGGPAPTRAQRFEPWPTTRSRPFARRWMPACAASRPWPRQARARARRGKATRCSPASKTPRWWTRRS